MTKRWFLPIVLLAILASLTTFQTIRIVAAQRIVRTDCPPREHIEDRLPILPEGQYPFLGFFIFDALRDSPGPSELTFTADPDGDGCYERYRAANRYVFTNRGGSNDESLLRVSMHDDTMHLFIGTGNGNAP